LQIFDFDFVTIVSIEDSLEDGGKKSDAAVVDICDKLEACKVTPIMQSGGPVLMSHRDPEITDDEKRLRKYGKGVNLTINPIGNGGFKRKTELAKWVSVPPGFTPHPSSSGEELRLSSSPFSFGFTI
jgi:hypothetical protein